MQILNEFHQQRYCYQYFCYFIHIIYFNIFQNIQNLIHNNQMSESDKNSIKLEEQQNNQEQYNENDNQQVQGQQDQQGQSNQQENNMQEQQALSGNANQGASQQLIKKRSHKRLEISNFIMKTYKILQDKRIANIVEWTDQGNCFIVKDKQKFSKQILPKYFKHSKFSSFVRQLNMYDFHKIRKQKQIPIFKHRYFQEGRADLLHKIKRKAGQDGKEEQIQSRQQINFSEPNIESRLQISYPNINVKTSTQSISASSTKNEIEMLKKENGELQQNISDISQEILFLELSKEKKKQKLVKIITTIMFFDLNFQWEQGARDQQNLDQTLFGTIRNLQDHFVRDQQPLSFSEYRKKLSQVYSTLKSNLLL